MGNRVVVSWDNGAFVSSFSPDFQDDLNDLVEQFGPPSNVVFRPKEND